MAAPANNISLSLAPTLLAMSVALFATSGMADESIDAGEEIASSKCGRCHSIAKIGASPNKSAPPFRTFKSKWPLEHLEEALGEGILTSHAMPEFTFDPDEIDDLLKFIGSLAPAKP